MTILQKKTKYQCIWVLRANSLGVEVSVAAMKQHNQKAAWEGKGLFVLYFHVIVSH